MSLSSEKCRKLIMRATKMVWLLLQVKDTLTETKAIVVAISNPDDYPAIYIYIYIYTNTWTYIHLKIQNMNLYINMYKHTYISTDINAHFNTDAVTHINTHAHIQAYIHTKSNTYRDTYTGWSREDEQFWNSYYSAPGRETYARQLLFWTRGHSIFFSNIFCSISGEAMVLWTIEHFVFAFDSYMRNNESVTVVRL